MKQLYRLIPFLLIALFGLVSCAPSQVPADWQNRNPTPDTNTTSVMSVNSPTNESRTVEYTLKTVMPADGNPTMAFEGVGGDIDGLLNPELTAETGDTVRITIINGDPMLHDFLIDEFGV
ncbi:MAG: hypothetical protein KDD89_02430, partial [Anaerolineales bacterium]|nr:hypothetical protein [Anaerolineales bacterium]